MADQIIIVRAEDKALLAEALSLAIEEYDRHRLWNDAERALSLRNQIEAEA